MSVSDREDTRAADPTPDALPPALHAALAAEVAALKAELEKLPPEVVCWLQEGDQFPTGLLNLVQDVLKESGYESQIQDLRKVPRSRHS